jgi:CheY-like chemotaxis protein
MDVVVCDDDAGVRRVVSEVAEGVGHHVLAETDLPTEAVELVDRFGAGLLILDLSLPYGDGHDALKALRRDDSPCQVVVFSAYATEPEALLEDGAVAVIDKLRFDDLEEVLRDLGRGDRRKQIDRVFPAKASLTSPRGVEPPEQFDRAMRAVRPLDVALTFAIDDHDAVTRRWGPLGAADLLLELARIARSTTRIQDRLGCPDGRHLELALLGSGPGGAHAVFQRVRRAWQRPGRPTFSAGYASVAIDEDPLATFRRARRALQVGLLSTVDELWQAGVGGI